MSGLGVLAVAATTAALAYLAATDPKRRRAFGLAPWHRPRHATVAWSIALGVGPILLAAGTASDVVVWLGAITVIGWGIAAVNPVTAGRLAQAAERMWPSLVGRCRRFLPGHLLSAAVRQDGLDRRIATLEQRIARLEARLAASSPSDTRPPSDRSTG